ncbi:hypothetical protein TVAG_138360 [Trichomonas vaginalis G3]|uniref:Repressor of RNA polymerase III transcription n=1 Tax=Trichomonas vaginalis (strain ATCC PRA-98 / G3) TaxID=412133 RepID=A2ENI9_TRIV3|nr:RNA polymerase III core binding [Trichomonas vaginalis G3]EAY05767.1 hypothetical protein TVAG_138360 [Trichomonas vaginalis G3]KAI5511410.1 RNA polymerase III core binding [Trichomonas vaginalis G3]|eukprot:XP_001317990.1 hypothetical protein [Trichomonas vaginalis G3]
MKWINSRYLLNVNQELSAACSSGSHIYGKVECFQFPSTISNAGISDDNLARSSRNRSRGESPLRIRATPHKDQFTAMKEAFENSFPDYEFSTLLPEHFQRIATPEQARSTISWNVSSYLPDNEALSAHLWNAIENDVSPAFCDIYAYEPTCSDVFTENGALWSKVFLFVNDKARKVLLFHIREGAQGFESEDEDESCSYAECLIDNYYQYGVF